MIGIKHIFTRIGGKIKSMCTKLKTFTFFLFLPIFYTTISGSSIFSAIWGLFLSLLKTFERIGTQAFSQLLGTFVNALGIMFQSWGFSLSGYGIWGPLMVVISLGVAGVMLYFFFAFFDGEQDVLGFEHDV